MGCLQPCCTGWTTGVYVSRRRLLQLCLTHDRSWGCAQQSRYLSSCDLEQIVPASKPQSMLSEACVCNTHMCLPLNAHLRRDA